MRTFLPSAALALVMAGGASAQEDPFLAALANLGGDEAPAAEKEVAEPISKVDGEIVYFDGEIKIEQLVPTLYLKEGVESAPKGYVPGRSAKRAWGVENGDNLYAMGDRGHNVPGVTNHTAEARYVRGETPLLQIQERNHVRMSGKLVVEQSQPAYVQAAATFYVSDKNYSNPYRCTLDVSLDGKALGEQVSIVPDNHGSPDGLGTVNFTQMAMLPTGAHELVVDAWCPMSATGNEVREVSFSGVYSEAEKDIRVIPSADVDEVSKVRSPVGQPALGVIWNAGSAKDIPTTDKAIGSISDAFDLVSGFAQHVGFKPDTHNKAVSFQTFWRPKEAGVYGFRVASGSNLCHGISGSRTYEYEGSDATFVECQYAFRHPAVSLHLVGDRRGIISSALQPASQSVLYRYGSIEITEDDVQNGLVLAFTAQGQIAAAARYNDRGREVDTAHDQGAIYDGGKLYKQASGRDDRDMGYYPTSTNKGFMWAQVLIKAPSDADYRQIWDYDTKPAEEAPAETEAADAKGETPSEFEDR